MFKYTNKNYSSASTTKKNPFGVEYKKMPELNYRETAKKRVMDILSKNHSQTETMKAFEGISDAAIEKNMPLAEKTARKNLSKSLVNGNFSNMRDGLALFYAADDIGNSKAMKLAKEAAYSTDTTPTKAKIPTFANTDKPKASSSMPQYFPSNSMDDLMPKPGARYVGGDSVRLRSGAGLNSSILGKVNTGDEVFFTGNKTKEIDGHQWAEVEVDGLKAWVAADYLKTQKPTQPKNETQKQQEYNTGTAISAPATSTSPVTSPTTSSTQNKNPTASNIDALNANAIQKEFNKVGDYDGRFGLQCPDIVKWYIDKYTPYKSVNGSGWEQVNNIAKTNGLSISNVPSAPAIFSVAKGAKGPGVPNGSSTTDGHTGIVLSCEKISDDEYKLTFIHTFSNVKEKENGQSSAIRTQTFKITDDITYVKVS